MSALTSLLVRDEVVSVRQIEDAIARQVLEGGELDTALLELDATAENVLNAYCAASLRLPAVSREEVMGVDEATLSLISKEQAARFGVIPITHDANTLVVATYQALHEASRKELGDAVGMQIECCIACELRIEIALAAHYGIKMSARMQRLADRVEQLAPGSLPSVEPMLETPISGLAAELFDDMDDADEAVDEPAGAKPIPYESLRPAPHEVSVARVVEVRPGQLPPAPERVESAPPAGADRKSARPPHDTHRGVGASKLPPPPDDLVMPVDEPPPPAAAASAKPSNGVSGKPAVAKSPAALARSTGARVANDVPRAKPKRTAGIPQGPMSRDIASQLLEKADDRDAVVEVFFRYARQFFDATALCSIREDRVLGREVHNVPNLTDIRGLSLSIPRGSALDEVLRTLQPRVSDLSRKAEDRPLAEALRRAGSQPSALLPICIQRRAVAIIYGDRGGEFFRQNDLGAMIELLPEVSRAFERIIRTRKVLGLSARQRTIAHAAAELGHAATQQLDAVSATPPADHGQDPAKAEALLRNARRALSALGAPRTAPPPPTAAARMAVPSVVSTSATSRELATAASAREAQAAFAVTDARAFEIEVTEGLQALDRIPTARLPAVDAEMLPDPARIEPEVAVKPPAYMSKPPPGAGRYSSSREGEGDEPQLEPQPPVESDTRPMRTRSNSRNSKRPRAPSPSDPIAQATADTIDNMTPPRFESPIPEPRLPSPKPSKPPPGTGVYSQQGVVSSEVISIPPARRSSQTNTKVARRSQPPKKTPSLPPAQSPAETKRSSKRPPPLDGRRETPQAGPVPEFAPLPKTGPYQPVPVPREASVIVDTLGQTRALIDDLCKCGPEDEAPTVQSLLRVGDEALDLLIERFPGPLWFDRRRPYARLPFGRDTGPIARALAAFGERALSRIVPLMRSQNPDVRYYATLFASDQVHADLLVPIAERLFDEDPQIRLMVRETLPSYRQLPAFAQVLGSLRTRMLEARAPLPARLAAIDAISNLRDGQSVPALIELLAHADRQLSIPAHRALVAITCQDFGSNTKKWRLWYEDNQHRHRVQWLIESLMHSEQNLRSAAGIELQKVTQVYYGFVASAPKRDRERAQKRYQDWWDSEGRKRL
jgi:Type II secretion system (T2SS), protein E, N-terminal domain